MKKSIIKMLNLQGVLIGKINISEEKNEIIIPCRSPRRMIRCPICDNSSKRVHQVSQRKVKHGMLNYRQVILALTVRRFKCKHCQKVFTETFPGINRDQSSANLKIQMLDWLRRNSFNFIGEQFNVSPSTLVRYVLKMNGDININWRTANVTKLGIDEHSFRGHYLIITITDLSNKKLLAVLKSDSQETLARFIREIPEEYREKIEEVCTDLRSSYKTVVEKLLSHADLTADRFHVETLARRALDEIRTVVQEEGAGSRMNLKKLLWVNGDALGEYEKERLDMAFQKYEKYPVLKQAYIIKEKIIFMYRAHSIEEAEKRFNHVMLLLETPEYSRYLRTLHATLKKWRIPILNYFKNKTTNGFTEGCHTKIKMIKRVSYGFRNIDNYIAKMTLAFLPLSFILNYHTV
ncbi:MAG: ISL3 family transposase [Patescibacteria group bacterium]|nr:ISL3 family transposase [Patescibacteria group bacterium]